MRIELSAPGFALALLVIAGGATSPAASGSAEPFVRHLQTSVPELLELTGVAGAAIAIVTDREVAWTGGFGVAERSAAVPVTPDTVYNVGSISKPVSALGIMRLIERGDLELDAPLAPRLPAWRGASRDPRITARMLLSHTAGLSLPAVPELAPGIGVPELADAIAGSVELQSPPGEGWAYSGGGYMVLQLLLEDLAGPLDDFLRLELFEPLGMSSTSYRWSPELLARSATPYDGGEPVGHWRYAGEAAASLNSSARDLSRLLVATLRAEPPLSLEMLDAMRRPAPRAEQSYGLRYGLGFDLWPVGEDDWLAGHNGQNTGWSATWWSRPATGDGLVVLTNDSDGRAAWKWIHCDWVHWMTGITWRGYCTDRPSGLTPPPPHR